MHDLEGAARGKPPLFVVFGAFGAGKTALAPLAARRLPECLVLDVDWLLPSLGAVAGRDLREDADAWPALGNVWLALAAASASAGRATMLFTPATPEEVEALADRRLAGDIHGLLLDCGEEELRRRLAERQGWRADWTEEAVEDAAKYRSLGHRFIRTDLLSEEECAASVVAWARGLLGK